MSLGVRYLILFLYFRSRSHIPEVFTWVRGTLVGRCESRFAIQVLVLGERVHKETSAGDCHLRIRNRPWVAVCSWPRGMVKGDQQ
jgi:hypothetical protein